MYKLRINPQATEDLLQIKEYISNEFQNPESAEDIVLKIIESYERLKQFPNIGIDLSSKVNVKTDFKYLISGNYIVFYHLKNRYILIERILYAGSDYLKTLFP